ncbi:hypothetical protein OSB04_019036 [Centaurea solstitialis]|uniref:Uncharacterized protein n=1 Tax=Centaurea solstitialis TaxID=347529 RepID=A0AA38SQ36_9ASTR|nr:hypothetical protein OSB04_019036 [Centaurea solstitialis]
MSPKSWNLRKSMEDFDVEFVYVHYPNLVSLKINHDLDFGLEPLGNDEDIINQLKYTSKYVYIEHGMTTLRNYLKSPNGSNVVIEELHDEEPHGRKVSSVGKKLFLEWSSESRVDEPLIEKPSTEKQHMFDKQPAFDKQPVLDEQPVLNDDLEDFDPFYGLFGERDGNLHTEISPHFYKMHIEVPPEDETCDDSDFDHTDLETIDMDDSDFESGEESDFDIERRRSLRKLRKQKKKVGQQIFMLVKYLEARKMPEMPLPCI